MSEIKYPELVILGSTGSVGSQAVDVACSHNVKVRGLSADRNVKLIESQARQFCVSACAMNDERAAKDLKERLFDTDIKVYSGNDGICEMIMSLKSEDENGQTVLNSIVGEAGLRPTLTTLNVGKKLALANKESLVVGGEFVMSEAKKTNTEIIPVDSEHSAIFQCLRAGNKKEIKKILLTASGGPFFGKTRDELSSITVENALTHPTWKMGAKITVDSATLMNKGFEVIEAAYLFDTSPDKIEVLVHRESIIHSAVEYIDNSVIAQMSVPDMRHCIQYALTHPRRDYTTTKELDLFSIGKLTFSKPDTENFRLLALAIETVKKGGLLPAVLNAANEEAVSAFLNHNLSFNGISDVVCETVEEMNFAKDIHSVDKIFDFCRQARECARSKIR